MKNKTVCVVGLGYVGLPLANAFSKHLKVIGYDVDGEKTRKLINNTKENIEFTSDPSKIKQADFILICVPTPVTKSKEPDLSYVKLFCKQKPLLKNAYAIRSGNCWTESQTQKRCCRSSIELHNLFWRY